MHTKILSVATVAALLLSGCFTETTQSDPNQQAAPALNSQATQPAKPKESSQNGSNNGETAGTGITDGNSGTEQKTDEQVQREITEKLSRLTDSKSGYVLPLGIDGNVEGATTREEVIEQLRKKGYSQQLAQTLAQRFYKENGGSVTVISRDGNPGRFDIDKDATFTKKNKWVWMIVQDHPDDLLHGAHTATYEVEVLKDATYRLNSWTIQPK